MTRRISVPPGFFNGRAAGDEVQLGDEETHYVRAVLRLGEGAVVELFDGLGHVADALILSPETGLVALETLEKRDIRESPLEIVLFQAIPKGKRWDWLIEKVTELGVHTIVPLQTDRTVVKVEGRKATAKLERWSAIVSGAARQCGRSRVPAVSAPATVAEALRGHPVDVHLAALLTGVRRSAAELLPAEREARRVGLWIGPEGDFTNGEVQRLLEAGARPLDLGPRILRVDTAAVAAVALVQAAAGDLTAVGGRAG